MELKEYLQNAEDSMQLAVEYLDDTLSHIRAGKASARLLDGIRVNYYGSMAPVSNVANECARCTHDRHHSLGEGYVQGDRESHNQFRPRHHAGEQR